MAIVQKRTREAETAEVIMEHAVTIRDVVVFVSVLGGIGVVLAAAAAVLWFFAQGWNH